ncbi:MAG: hybrid sensor histidine kinase/response regulator [Caldilineaceae bacterium]|nr:hybrid sensor histidine kinase/response regulator [Caldilineaceae bacterium]
MSRKESEFLKRLLVTFQGEAEERVRALASGLIALEKAPEPGKQAEIVEEVFREVHSLKGAARSVNLTEIEAICQAMEDVFAALKRNKITPSLILLDHLHQATDLLNRLLAANPAEASSQEKARHAPLIRRLKELARQNFSSLDATSPANSALPAATLEDPVTEDPAAESPAATARAAQPPSSATPPWAMASRATPHPAVTDERHLLPETVRISADRLEALLLQVEELVSVKLAVTQRAAELRAPVTQIDLWSKTWAKYYPSLRYLSKLLEKMPENVPENIPEKPDNGDLQPSERMKIKREMTALLEFLVWNQAWVEALGVQLTTAANSAAHDQRTIGGMVDHLLQDMKQVLMLPISSLLEIFPSLARDLARQQHKEVEIVFHGTEIEVDRRILQEIKDPLLHLVRNCIDHGIETPSVRENKQKPRRGVITLTVAQKDSSKFEILLSDDGEGVDRARVRETAARLGIVSAEVAEKMSQQEINSLIFQSGFSTSPLITDISGRGLGLAIVQEKVEKLGGTITLETESGKGTTFHLLLPLTLATLRGLLVRCEGRLFILPLLYIERVARLNRSEIQTVQNRATISLEGQTVSLVQLGQALELPPQHASPGLPGKTTDKVHVVILNTAEKRLAFSVDEIIGEQEVLMKGLGPQLVRVRNIAGATVLGTGQVVPILNVLDLMKSAIKTVDGAAKLVEQSRVELAPTLEKSILVVEDSITARMQLKNILELNGYTVQTAVDGLDALLTLRSKAFDLVVSDVDMPRLNGLDLTARIRNDKELAALPVVLVTALASRQDQERGIEVGANAYITKGNFDQNKLLDVIERLI